MMESVRQDIENMDHRGLVGRMEMVYTVFTRPRTQELTHGLKAQGSVMVLEAGVWGSLHEEHVELEEQTSAKNPYGNRKRIAKGQENNCDSAQTTMTYSKLGRSPKCT